MNMSNNTGIKLLNKAINNVNLTTNYATSILMEKQMNEIKFKEKTIRDLDNKNLTQNEKIQKISKTLQKRRTNEYSQN